MPLSEITNDLSAIGGVPVYAALTAGLFVSGRFNDALVLAIAFILAYAAVILARSVWFRERPKPENYNSYVTKFDANSLVSIHAARAAILAAFVWLRVGWTTGILAAALALIVAGTRVALKRHHVSDVIVGLSLGIIAFLAADWIVLFIL